jgi:hypothetical protein
MGFKIKDFIKLGLGVGGAVAPGAAGGILSIINKSIDDDADVGNAEASRQLAKNLEEVAEVLRDHEKRLRKLEGR